MERICCRSDLTFLLPLLLTTMQQQVKFQDWTYAITKFSPKRQQYCQCHLLTCKNIISNFGLEMFQMYLAMLPFWSIKQQLELHLKSPSRAQNQYFQLLKILTFLHSNLNTWGGHSKSCSGNLRSIWRTCEELCNNFVEKQSWGISG